MTDATLEAPVHTNGVLPHAPPATSVESEEPDGKKGRKKLKKELRKRREFLERFPEAPLVPDASAAAQLEQSALASSTHSAHLMNDWFRPVSLTLNNDSLIASQRASVLIAVNALMLALWAHAVFLQPALTALGLALIPIALTNALSLVFALSAARSGQPATTLAGLCALPAAEYEPALNRVLADKEHLYASLRRDLHLLGAGLAQRERQLRTAINVLLGGVPLSALFFAVSLALSSKP